MLSFVSAPRRTSVSNGLKRQELLQSQSPDLQKTYSSLLGSDQESLTTVQDNDVASKFRVMYTQFSTTVLQRSSLEELERAFRGIEFQIDPQRLQFSFGRTPDEDVVINHSYADGVSTLIVHDDGSVALSFIARPGSKKKSQLTFHEHEDADWEALSLRFLIGQ
jgi:hypothetical protein